MSIRRAVVLGFVLAPALASGVVTTSVVDIPSRGDIQRFLYVHPDAPVANLIALPGGDGVLGIQDDGSMLTLTAACNPVSRNRQAFANHGLAVALVDATSTGSVRNFSDVLEVIRYMQARDNVPTWLIGGSSSSRAIWNMAINLPIDSPVGAIFFSPESLNASHGVLMTRPTLVVSHVGDPSHSGVAFYNSLTSAPVKERITLSGGGNGGCGYHLFNGIDAAFVDATTGFIDRYNGSFANGMPDLDQHGLTGIWYEPASSGQGLAFEVFTDLLGAGSGLLSGGWFTYDIAPAGGAEKQRWYSVSGPMMRGATSAAVTIYQNVGGNFDAAPVTNAQTVGTGTLAFATCDSAQLSYAFADGRTGALALSRITSNVECSTTTLRTTNADFDLSGNWYEPSTSGQGLVLEVNPVTGALYFAWYTYAPNAAASGVAGQRWYTGLGSYVAGARTVTVPLYQTIGGIFDTPTPATQATTAIGTATLLFASCTNASLAYAFTGGTNAGLSGTIALQRIGPTPSGCIF